MAHTIKVRCPKCGSDDCNYTTEDLGKAIRARIGRVTTFCNKCTYTKVVITISGKEIFTETKMPDSDDTELVYMFLGKERG